MAKTSFHIKNAGEIHGMYYRFSAPGAEWVEDEPGEMEQMSAETASTDYHEIIRKLIDSFDEVPPEIPEEKKKAEIGESEKKKREKEILNARREQLLHEAEEMCGLDEIIEHPGFFESVNEKLPLRSFDFRNVDRPNRIAGVLVFGYAAIGFAGLGVFSIYNTESLIGALFFVLFFATLTFVCFHVTGCLITIRGPKKVETKRQAKQTEKAIQEWETALRKKGLLEWMAQDSAFAVKVYHCYPGKPALEMIRRLNPEAAGIIENGENQACSFEDVNSDVGETRNCSSGDANGDNGVSSHVCFLGSASVGEKIWYRYDKDMFYHSEHWYGVVDDAATYEKTNPLTKVQALAILLSNNRIDEISQFQKELNLKETIQKVSLRKEKFRDKTCTVCQYTDESGLSHDIKGEWMDADQYSDDGIVFAEKLLDNPDT